ncbi:Protein archease [Trichinella pseudospiralis]|uniref:Protein archease-like n=1 Tax=Trichinella pseudospiralis TaxID=6337 RepID=A0A0V1E7D1_TRIPS|nr:Protein archease [Trichinella pseudospiralis]
MNPFCRSVASSSCGAGSPFVPGMVIESTSVRSRSLHFDLIVEFLREIFREHAIDCNFDVRLETYSCKMVSEDKRRFGQFLQSIGPHAAPHDLQLLAPCENLSPDFRNSRRAVSAYRTESGGEICHRYTIENKRLFYLMEALSFCFEGYDFMKAKSSNFCRMPSFLDVQNSVNWKVLPFFRNYRYISGFIWNKIKEVIDADRCVFYGYIPEEGDPISEDSCLSSSTFLMYNPFWKRILCMDEVNGEHSNVNETKEKLRELHCFILNICLIICYLKSLETLILMLRDSEELPNEDDALVRSSTDCPFNNTIKYEHLDHTADIMLHAWGDNLIEAFEQVTMAMFAYLTDLNKVDACFSYDVEVRGSDEKTMLFDFLNEWFAAFNGEPFFIPRYIKIISFNLVDGYMAARAWGESFDVSKHIQRIEVKAVTFNNMRILNKDNGYEIFVVLDI